jgi:DNA-binding PadR family transcriptional regulator
MKPLNFAILKYFTKVSRASLNDVIEALKNDYSSFKAFNKTAMMNALLTAEANGLIEEVDVDLDENGELRIYYAANEESKETINYFIED